ncbi:MAG: hypothetical protein WAN48_10785 [Actinomycetes bacterium]
MRGDPGPYLNDEGGRWVPRTVPYLDARRIAKTEVYGDERLVYIGKEDADLLGFTRECFCDEVCEASRTDDEPNGTHPCRVPAWHFEVRDRWGEPVERL